jgi:ribose transport system substrate-binding protein
MLSRYAIAALGAAAFAGLFTGTAQAEEPKISIALPGPNSYFDPWGQAVADAAAKYGFTGTFDVPPTDAFNLTQQNQLVDSLAGRGYTGFGLFPGDANGTNAQEQKLLDRGILSVNVNGCTYDPSPALFCVSTDVYQAAYYQAQQLIEAIGGQGDIALLTSQLTDPNTQLRIKAVEKAVEETSGKVKLVQTVADIDTPQAAPPAINALLAARGDTLAGAMATSYYPSVALATALTDNEQFRRIKGVVAENAPQVMNALEKGYLYGTLFQNTYGMAYVASYTLYKALKDKCTVREDAPFSESPQTKKLLSAGVLLVTQKNFADFKDKPESLPEDTDRLMKLVDEKILQCP